MAKENDQIIPLPKAQWAGTIIPIGYTTHTYYDVAVEKNTDGYSIKIEKKTLDEPITHTPEEYDFLHELSKELDMPLNKVARLALFEENMKEIVQRYRKRAGDSYLERYVTCGLDEESARKMEGLEKVLNENTQALRQIGANLSAFCRDIQKAWYTIPTDEGAEALQSAAEGFMDTYRRTMEAQAKLAEQAAQLLAQTHFRVQVHSRPQY